MLRSDSLTLCAMCLFAFFWVQTTQLFVHLATHQYICWYNNNISCYIQVYISCSVLMCEAGNPNTRCSRGCINSTRSGSHHHHHRKREAVIQSASHFVSQGPLRLRRSAESTENTGMITWNIKCSLNNTTALFVCLKFKLFLFSPVTNLNLNLNLVFIAGCLLAAVGMISAVVMYKAKMSKVKYQPLPVFEN